MMAAAVDIHSGEIHYEYYINSLMVSGFFLILRSAQVLRCLGTEIYSWVSVILSTAGFRRLFQKN